MGKADPLWEEAVQRAVSDPAVSAALPWPMPNALAHLGPPISRKIRPGASLPGHPLRLEGHRPCTSDSTAQFQSLWVLMGPQYHTTCCSVGHPLGSPTLPTGPAPSTSQGEMKGEPALWLCLPCGVSWLQTVLPSIRAAPPPNFCCFGKGLKTQILNIGTSPLLLPS